MWNELTTLVSDRSLPLVIDATIKTSLIMILAIVLDRMLTRTSAAVRHRVWGVSLCSALFVPILTVVLPQWQLPILPQRTVTQTGSMLEDLMPEPNHKLMETRESIERSMARAGFRPEFEHSEFPIPPHETDPNHAATSEPNTNSVRATPTNKTGPTNQTLIRWGAEMVIGILLVAGFAWKLVPILVGLVANHRLIRRSQKVLDGPKQNQVVSLAARLGMSRTVSLYEADVSVVPMTLGVLRPVVVLPGDWGEWTEEQRECVLLHELAHIKRFDVAYQLIGCFASALHWFNPLVGYALRQLRIERELACDDCVLEAGELPSEYAKQLVVIARAYQPYRPSVSVAMASSARLDDRIRAILDSARSRLPLSGRKSLAIASIASVVVLSIAVIRPIARPAIADELTNTISDTPASDNEATIRAEPKLDSNKEIIVKGIVLKPDGTPAAGATVRSTARVVWPMTKFVSEDFEPPIAKATCNERGGFEILVDQHPYGELPEAADEDRRKLMTISATSDGYGPAWIAYDSIDPSKPVTLRLVEDVPIRGRVIDLEGRPLANTWIHIKSIRSGQNDDLSRWLDGVEAKDDAQTLSEQLVRRMHPRELGITKEFRSGQDGSFEIRGIGRDRVVEIAFQSDQVGLEFVLAVTRTMPASAIPQFMSQTAPNVRLFGAEFTYTASPSPPISGIVVDDRTKEPLSNVSVEIYFFTSGPNLKTKTDSQGRFRLTGYPTSDPSGLLFRPSGDQPYLMRKLLPPDAKSLGPREMTVELHRGIWITGRVTDQLTKDPVPGVTMLYLPWRTNPFAQSLPSVEEIFLGYNAKYQTDKNGNFRMPGLPGPAIVGAVDAPKPYRFGKGYDEVAKITPKWDEASGDLDVYGDSVCAKWPDAMLSINPSTETETIELNLELDPGEKIQIELVDEMDRPVTGGRIVGLEPNEPFFHMAPSGSEAHVFEAVCFGPDEVRSIIALHTSRKLGFATRVGPEQIKEGKIRMRLLPLASVTGRLMSDGEPLPGIRLQPSILPVEHFSPHLETVTTNKDGRFTIEMPSGCEVHIFTNGPGVDESASLAEEISVMPGQKKDLGTLTLSKDGKFVAEK